MVKIGAIVLLLAFAYTTVLTSCRKKGCTDPSALNYDIEAQKDDGLCLYDNSSSPYKVTISFSQNFDGLSVTNAEFSSLQYTNQNGDLLSVTKLRYMVSDVRFYLANGDSVMIDGYHLIDVSSSSTFNYVLPSRLAEGEYVGIGMAFGMGETDNISGAHVDLNAASWSWPVMLGGGYHFMQLEGRFVDVAADTSSYAYHMGVAREITPTDTIFHPNHFVVQLPNSEFSVAGEMNIEVKMNIAEWFKNPNMWDLNTYSSMLMQDYDAQVMMNQNGRNCFEVGTIIQL